MEKIKWSDKSIIHLKAIHDYISKDSVFYAERFVKGLIKSTEKLKKFRFPAKLYLNLKSTHSGRTFIAITVLFTE